MREFGQKYEGNIQLALRGFQKERLAAAGGDATFGEIDKSMRKRKWIASQDTDTEPSGSSQPKDTDPQRTLKNGQFALSPPCINITHSLLQLEYISLHQRKPDRLLDLELHKAPEYQKPLVQM